MMARDSMPNGDQSDRGIGRRTLLKRLGAGFLAAPGLLGATVAGASGPRPAEARAALPEPRTGAAPVVARQRRGGTITLGTAQDFPGMDPMVSRILNAWNLHTLLWNGLTRYDELMEVQPDLAERWDVP